MTKINTALVTFVLTAVSFIGGLSYSNLRHPVKHTQKCTLVYVEGHQLYFIRPNKEIFIMYFEDPVPTGLRIGLAFHDVSYRDAKYGMVQFVKAQPEEQ